MLLEPPRQEAGNFEPIANDFGGSHGFKITRIRDSSLAGRANLLAERAKGFVEIVRRRVYEPIEFKGPMKWLAS
jgi:hypothetical protein